jgi:hypothetical protein
MPMNPSPSHPESEPGRTAFLTGCGRSGTTILGKVLARHPDIAYVNDRFSLWIEPFPFADVWGLAPAPANHEPRIALDESDAASAGDDARARFLGSLDRARAGRRVLVEKVAINNFRLPFLAAIVSQARFINIVRHGVEVARSIARAAQAGRWYGRDDAKWLAIEHHARAVGAGHLLPHCSTDYARGLLEWRLSVEAAERFHASRPEVPWLALRYEQLLSDPVGTARAMALFLGLPPSPPMERFAVATIRRQNPAAHEAEVPPETQLIAGDLLERLGYSTPAGTPT